MQDEIELPVPLDLGKEGAIGSQALAELLKRRNEQFDCEADLAEVVLPAQFAWIGFQVAGDEETDYGFAYRRVQADTGSGFTLTGLYCAIYDATFEGTLEHERCRLASLSLYGDDGWSWWPERPDPPGEVKPGEPVYWVETE